MVDYRKFFIYLSAVALLSANLYSAEEFEEDFLSLLNEATTIATKRKVNITHQASTVSVLTYEEMKKRGFKNIHEAISTFPGFEGYITNIGWKELTVRGVYTTNVYGFDKIKLLVDGVSINNALYGTIYYYLDLPIDIVERIEVLRGPGSVMYGTGAFSGAINIITKDSIDKSDRYFVSYDSYNYKSVGTKQYIKAGNFDIYLDGYYQSADKSVKSTTERRNAKNLDLSGMTNEFLLDQSAGVTIENNDFSFISRIKKSKSGDYYGNDEYEFGLNKNTSYYNTLFFLQGNYNKSLEEISIDVKAGYKFYEFDSNLYDTPKKRYINKYSSRMILAIMKEKSMDYDTASNYAENNGFISFIQNGFYQHEKLGYFSSEVTTYSQTNLSWKKNRHLVDFGIANEYVRNKDNYLSFNIKPDEELQSIIEDVAATENTTGYNFYNPYTDDYGFIGKNINRTTNSIYLRDLYIINNKTDMNFGYRIDSYSDINREQPSYNIGLVYRQNDNLIYKLAYGSAYRAPSFIEIYSESPNDFRAGNLDLKPEQITTTEGSLLFLPSNNIQLKTTLYHSVLKDAIDLAIDCEDLRDDETYISCENSHSFTNYPKRVIDGLELEYTHKLGISNIISLNYTKIKTLATGWQPYITDPHQKDIPFVDIAEELANLSHTYFLNNRLSFNTVAQYTGEKAQNSQDTTLPAVTIVNENINYQYSKDLFIQFSVENLFNEIKYVPSYWGFHEEGLSREERYYSFKVVLEL